MYYISDSHALLLLRHGDLIVSWFIHSFIPSIHPMLDGQRSLIYDNILLLCSTFLCMIMWYGIRCGAGTWWKTIKKVERGANVPPHPPHPPPVMSWWDTCLMTSSQNDIFDVFTVMTRILRMFCVFKIYWLSGNENEKNQKKRLLPFWLQLILSLYNT